MLGDRAIMRTKLLGAFLWFLTTAAAVRAEPDPFLIVPGRGIGPFQAGMTRSEIQKLLKPEELGEQGEGGAALTAYFLNVEKRITLLLDGQGKVTALSLHGDRSVWHTASGITLGTPLSLLQKLNGKPLRLRGFDGSARSGQLLDWGGGALAKGLAKVKLTFASPARAAGYGRLTEAQKLALEKPRDFLSTDAELRQLDPVVETLELAP